MKDDAAQRADEPQHERREPTFGEIREPPPREAPAAARARPDRIDADARVLDGFSLGLARGESIIDNAETSAGAGLSRLVLTDRRLIVLGRDHQTVYPLRGVTRLAVVRYLRWGWSVLGLALALAGAIAALVPTPFLPAGPLPATNSSPLTSTKLAYLAAGSLASGRTMPNASKRFSAESTVMLASPPNTPPVC